MNTIHHLFPKGKVTKENAPEVAVRVVAKELSFLAAGTRFAITPERAVKGLQAEIIELEGDCLMYHLVRVTDPNFTSILYYVHIEREEENE